VIHSEAFVIVSLRERNRAPSPTLGVVDVLADLLQRARAHGAVFAHSTFHAPWGLEITDHGPLSFHAILAGTAWIVPPEEVGSGPVQLVAGDVALVRSPYAHRLVDDPSTPTRPISMAEEWRVPGDPYRYRNQGAGQPTVLLCGAFRFEGDICASLLDALPPVVCLHAGDGEEIGSLHAAVRILAAEFAHDAPGQQAVLDRLLDLLLVFALRTWFRRPDAAAPAWYRALDDPEIGSALRLIHADPARPWTVDTLASNVGLSRAAFARRFAGLVAEPPLTYLTRWRMAVAAELLRETDSTIATVAKEVGYQNEFAFATAFRRVVGDAPTRYRARHHRPVALTS
jgi:AraC-like DNA-binding protein